jgi:hypothetical protein
MIPINNNSSSHDSTPITQLLNNSISPSNPINSLDPINLNKLK